ncbi:MAG TPA: DUF4386 domain-containing protein [Thermoanaerobaculia bacterium]
MEDRFWNRSPAAFARLGGVLYLAIIAIGAWGEMGLRDKVFVSGDATATAQNLKAMESLWRLGLGAEFVLLLLAVSTTWILWLLLRPVNRDLAWLSIFFNLVSIALEAGAVLRLAEALFPLGDTAYWNAFLPAQRHILAVLPFRAHTLGFAASLIFFGGYCLVVGRLVYQSGFLPKALGVLMALAGVCYLVNSFALFLSPKLAGVLFPAILVPSFLGELSLALWLAVKGVDAAKWRAVAGTAALAPQRS